MAGRTLHAPALLALIGLLTSPAVSEAAVIGTIRNDTMKLSAQLEYDGQGWKQYRIIRRSIVFDDPNESSPPITFIYDCSKHTAQEVPAPINSIDDAKLGYTYSPAIPNFGKWREFKVGFDPIDGAWVLFNLLTLSRDGFDVLPRVLSTLALSCRNKPDSSDGIELPFAANDGGEAYFLLSNRFNRVGDVVDYWVTVHQTRKFKRTYENIPDKPYDLLAVNDDVEKRKLNVVADCRSGKMAFKRIVDYENPASSHDTRNPTMDETVPESVGEAMVKAACQIPNESRSEAAPLARKSQRKASKSGKAV